MRFLHRSPMALCSFLLCAAMSVAAILPANAEKRIALVVGNSAYRNVPPLALRAMGLVSPLMRGLAEMAYEFEEPFILDTTKFESAFGTAVTPLATAVADTVAWYRTRAGAQ